MSENGLSEFNLMKERRNIHMLGSMWGMKWRNVKELGHKHKFLCETKELWVWVTLCFDWQLDGIVEEKEDFFPSIKFKCQIKFSFYSIDTNTLWERYFLLSYRNFFDKSQSVIFFFFKGSLSEQEVNFRVFFPFSYWNFLN